jgi:hypothetical protein
MSTSLLSADSPLYSHPLPQIEQWLTALDCQQDKEELHCWWIDREEWQAKITLETEEIVVCYYPGDLERSVVRAFKYSLSRQDVEAAILAGP